MPSAREVLVAALEDVQEANVPEDLREIAFSKVFDLRSGTASLAAPPPSGTQPPPPASTHPAQAPPKDTAGDPLSNIATRLGLSRETVNDVFTFHNGELELIVSGGKLASKTATATKEIALLVASGRQAAGTEEWTSWDVIREACADFKKLDKGNFAKTIREMDDAFNFRKESARKSLVRLAKPGWEQSTALVRRFGGEH